MNKLWDKLVLFISCLALMTQNSIGYDAIAAMLCAIIGTAVAQCFPKSGISLGAEMIYLTLCLTGSDFCFFMPLILYDVMCDKKYPLLITVPISIACNFPNANSRLLLLIGCVLIAVTLQKRTEKNNDLEQTLIRTRDDSAELNILLVEKNKSLRRNQDYEIYLATLKERNRIAREIHDNVGHMLTRSILQLGALSVINKDESINGGLTDLKETLNNAMTSIRSSVHELHDDSVDLKMAVSDCIQSMDGKYKIECDYDFTDAMPRDVKLCFIGIVKESLSNVVKHSSGEYVRIIIREHPALYQLTVQDNGECSGEIKETGIGLTNMKDRAASLNGTIHIESKKQGFKIFVSVPKKD